MHFKTATLVMGALLAGMAAGFDLATGGTQLQSSASAISIDQGLGWRMPWVNLGVNPHYSTKNYYGDLAWGKTAALQYETYVSEKTGWGFRVSEYFAVNGIDNIPWGAPAFDTIPTSTGTEIDTVYPYTGSFLNQVSMTFIGLTFLTRRPVQGLPFQATWIGSLDAGILYYREALEQFPDLSRLTHESFILSAFPIAIGFSGGLNVPLGGPFAFHADVRFLGSYTNEKTRSENGQSFKVNERETFHRVDFNLGLKYLLPE